jgi:hypothetical protein
MRTAAPANISSPARNPLIFAEGGIATDETEMFDALVISAIFENSFSDYAKVYNLP